MSPTPEPPPKKASPPGRFQVAATNLILPGIGTLIARRPAEGYAQLGLFVLGVLTSPFLFGLAVAAGAWTWSQVSTIEFLSRRRQAS